MLKISLQRVSDKNQKATCGTLFLIMETLWSFIGKGSTGGKVRIWLYSCLY